ncbi:MAG: hypothetical protein IKY59_01055, partial [Oscillospiraceae bacterium]|nr:hypothetical protein [Oscillospiraceae bacterium]
QNDQAIAADTEGQAGHQHQRQRLFQHFFHCLPPNFLKIPSCCSRFLHVLHNIYVQFHPFCADVIAKKG